MTKNNGFKVAALAASIALAMGATSAMAADPATNAIPGQGKVTTGAAVVTPTGTTAAPIMGIAITGNTVIDWGKGTTATDLNNTGTAGFNIGSAATVNFTGGPVLNIDSSGNASQIFGKLTSAGNVFVANSNGIVVGSTADISGTAAVGLIANTRGVIAFDGSALDTSIEFNGTGGNVSVAKGAKLAGTTVLVSGGGTVNIDLSTLTGGAATIQAGVKNSSSALPTVGDNTSAVLTTTGDLGAATLAGFASAGDASVSGTTLALGSNARVDGTLTNTGTLGLATGFVIDGELVNNKTVTQTDNASAGSVVNNGAYTGGGFTLNTTDGGITNGGSMTGLGYVSVHKGDVVNNGTFDSGTNDVDTYGGGSVTNNGSFKANYVDIYEGGNFSNVGTMVLGGNVYVVNGSITNSGKLTLGGYYLETVSDTTAGNGFTAGGKYYIDNTGTVTAAGDLTLSANAEYWGDYDSATSNDSTGSVTNSGTLQLGSASELDVYAHNGVTLGGTVQAKSGTSYKALSATNPLSGIFIYGAGWDAAPFTTGGVVTVATDLVTDGSASVYGGQVKLMGNLSAVDATGTPVNTIDILAGAKSATDYAVRVASGKTVTAAAITVDGDKAGHESNVILQGTLAAQDITFGGTNPVSDVYTGPAGSLSLSNIGTDPTLTFNFTGAVKTVPYNNTATNFRYNGLNVVTDGSPLALTLNPTAYTTNGTTSGTSDQRSAVNILVNGDVNLSSATLPTAPVLANGSAVTGVTNTPNTHLVLQSSGNIEVGNGTDFYWPGYVYLGNVLADSDGNAQPGTAGLGTITTDGNFNNVLPGDIAGASGIHFITQFPLTLGGDVVTNANAWVNFGTDLLTTKYSSEQNATTGPFFGGTQGSGSVINYGVLDAASFHTHAPDATK